CVAWCLRVRHRDRAPARVAAVAGSGKREEGSGKWETRRAFSPDTRRTVSISMEICKERHMTILTDTYMCRAWPHRRWQIVLGYFLLAGLNSLDAQSPRSSIRGVVRDSSNGMRLPNAVVELRQGDQLRSSRSADSGVFAFPGIAPGHYRLGV